MSIKVPSAGETLPTFRARERPFPGVAHAMPIQTFVAVEAFPALGAEKGLFSRVNPLVAHQFRLAGKTLVTFRTRVWLLPGVDSLVFYKTSFSGKTFPTFWTCIGFLACVTSLVRYEV